MTEVASSNHLHGKLVERTGPSADRVPDFCPNTEVRWLPGAPAGHPAQLPQSRLQWSALEQVAGRGPSSIPSSAWTALRPSQQGTVCRCAVAEAGGRDRLLSQALPRSITADGGAVQDSLHVELNARVRQWMREHEVVAYDEVAHTGCVRAT